MILPVQSYEAVSETLFTFGIAYDIRSYWRVSFEDNPREVWAAWSPPNKHSFIRVELRDQYLSLYVQSKALLERDVFSATIVIASPDRIEVFLRACDGKRDRYPSGNITPTSYGEPAILMLVEDIQKLVEMGLTYSEYHEYY